MYYFIILNKTNQPFTCGSRHQDLPFGCEGRYGIFQSKQIAEGQARFALENREQELVELHRKGAQRGDF